MIDIPFSPPYRRRRGPLKFDSDSGRIHFHSQRYGLSNLRYTGLDCYFKPSSVCHAIGMHHLSFGEVQGISRYTDEFHNRLTIPFYSDGTLHILPDEFPYEFVFDHIVFESSDDIISQSWGWCSAILKLVVDAIYEGCSRHL